MSKTATAKSGPTAAKQAQSPNAGAAAAYALAGWFLPGAGHALEGRWKRGIVYFLIVAAMAITGYLQQGFVFSPHFSNAFGLLGFLADIGAGIFYFTAKIFEIGGPDIARASGDYGTRFIATAGVLNLLFALDAYGIAIGQKD